MGRPKGGAFEELGFEMIKEKRKYCAFCGLCGKILKNTAANRLKAHRNMCKRFVAGNSSDGQQFEFGEARCPNPFSAGYSKMQIKEEITSPPSAVQKIKTEQMDNIWTKQMPIIKSVSSLSSVWPAASKPSASTPAPSKPKIGKITKRVDSIPEVEIENINFLLGKLIYGCNLPLRVVESSHFKKIINKLQPAYSTRLPSEREISTSILDNVYDDCLLKSKDNVKPESVLLIDGWTNLSGKLESAVSMIHNVNGYKVFVDAWDLSGLPDNPPDIVGCSIEKAKKLYTTDIYAVVSANASSNLSINQSGNRTVWHTTCSSHAANLLAIDLISNSLTEKVTTILHEFKHPNIQKALIDNGGRMIVLPCKTQACSYRDSYVSLIDNLHVMRTQFTAGANIKLTTIKLLLCEKFIEEVKDHIELLSPICNLINMCQMDSTSVADAVNVWLQLRLPDKFHKQFEINIEMHRSMVLNEFSLSSFYLHPFYNNSYLTDEQKQKVYTFLFNELNGKGIEEWAAYKNNEHIFKILYEKDVEDPFVFWSMAGLQCHNLPQIATKLLNIPASTAQIGRLYSRLDHVHNLNGNELTFEQSKKFLHVYYTLGMNEDQST